MAKHEFNGAFNNAKIKYKVPYGKEYWVYLNASSYHGDCTYYTRRIKELGYEVVKITDVDINKFLGCFIDDPETVYRNMQTKR